MREAAELARVSYKKMVRRLRVLDSRIEGGLLLSFEGKRAKRRGKLFISPDGLRAYARSDLAQGDERIAELESRLEDVVTKQLALRSSHQRLRRDFEGERRRQRTINENLAAASMALQKAIAEIGCSEPPGDACDM
jgi:chromosome segregation ATPase